MNTRKYLKVLYLLMVLTFFLPWFTYNSRVMGYRFGFVFWKWFTVPLVILALCLFRPGGNRVMIVLAELAQIGYLAALICALGFWQQVCNIKSGFHLLEGLKTAQAGYWIAVVSFAVQFVSYQIELIKGTVNATQG